MSLASVGRWVRVGEGIVFVCGLGSSRAHEPCGWDFFFFVRVRPWVWSHAAAADLNSLGPRGPSRVTGGHYKRGGSGTGRAESYESLVRSASLVVGVAGLDLGGWWWECSFLGVWLVCMIYALGGGSSGRKHYINMTYFLTDKPRLMGRTIKADLRRSFRHGGVCSRLCEMSGPRRVMVSIRAPSYPHEQPIGTCIVGGRWRVFFVGQQVGFEGGVRVCGAFVQWGISGALEGQVK